MPTLVEDAWINEQAVTHSISEIEGCAIAVEATYYLQLFFDTAPYHEPLLPALGGLTGIHKHIESDLDQWKAHGIVPFFIFDGQPVTGQDDVSLTRGLRANEKTSEAWELYFNGRAEEAVLAFGANAGAFRPQAIYPLLQGILKQRGLHFLVPPYNAAAQIAYFEMVDSDQCAGIMGSQELLLYPIKDSIIRSIDWETKSLTAISKKHIVKALNVSEPLFLDALLMTGTSFLPPFPALVDPTIIKNQPFTISDAVNMLRTSDKSVAIACTSFNDIVQLHDPTWLDKYRKARMVVNHFIYIAEDGEIKVNDFEHLTGDNHEYLGLQLPSELFHYLNTGLIGPRILSWITHGQLVVLPTTDGVASDEYKKLVSSQLVPIRELALALVIPRLHRGIGHKNINMRVWYDRNFSHAISSRSLQPPPFRRISQWTVSETSLKEHVPNFVAGSIASEVLALRNSDFAKTTIAESIVKGVESGDAIVSLAIWRLLHLRGYINDSHTLTNWGNALATAVLWIKPTTEKNPDVPNLNEALLVAFELIRFDILNARNKHEELRGLPMNGDEDDQSSLLLISRCATLLKLRHEANGYTGPLSKNLLAFRSLISEVRSADRDLTEAILASMFMHAQAKRDRSDNWEISHRLPFLNDPDVALGIAVKTYFDDISPSDTPEQKALKKQEFPGKYLPYALRFSDDIDMCCAFFDAIYAGVKTLGNDDISAGDREAWDKAAKYLDLRR
ncbi:hypothetical protein VTK73DRAFT_4598 [Phialemonium thermophilum]|uniref:XPG N-terminal domain-containing protein n=1 Tax=Phialemonium thermophilum TaxID=223376 RepID=A0ABR3XYR4_9PEZI